VKEMEKALMAAALNVEKLQLDLDRANLQIA
jgi:hypothetical protein